MPSDVVEFVEPLPHRRCRPFDVTKHGVDGGHHVLVKVRLALFPRLPDVDDAKDPVLVIEPCEMDQKPLRCGLILRQTLVHRVVVRRATIADRELLDEGDGHRLLLVECDRWYSRAGSLPGATPLPETKGRARRTREGPSRRPSHPWPTVSRNGVGPLERDYPGHMIELVLVNGERRTLIPREDAEEAHQLTQLMEHAGFFRHGWPTWNTRIRTPVL